jgi:hypothetical protein
LTGLLITGLSYVLVAWRWPSLTNLQTALVSLSLAIAVFGLMLGLEYQHRKRLGKEEILTERLKGANAALAVAWGRASQAYTYL